MKIFLKRLHAYFYRFNVGIIFILLWPFLYYFSRKPERYKYMNKMRKLLGIVSSLLSGIIYRYQFEEPIDWRRTYVICPNHTSNLDITAISTMAENNYSFMGKDELRDGFVTGLFFRTVDIPVNRESKMSSFRAFKSASERLANSMSMVIYPEGTIPPNYPPELQEFKNGPFRLAIEHQVPIMPVSGLNIWKIFWDNGLKYGSKPGICKIFVHKPVETVGLTIEDADALRIKVQNIIAAKLNSK